MSTIQTQSLQRVDPERGVEFIPFGSADKIKLSVKIIQNMVAVPTKSGRTCSERDALRFLMLCQAQRLNPFAGDAYLVGYDTQNGPSFSLITAHQAFLKRAETCADFEGMESGIILQSEDGTVTEREGDFHLEDERVIGGWARVHRKGRKPTYRRLRLSRFNTGFAQWKVDAAGMITKCAESDALRSTFPTLLGGLYIEGEQDQRADRIVTEMSANRTSFDPKGLVETTAVAAAPDNTRSVGQVLQNTEEMSRAADAQSSEGTDLAPQPKSPPAKTTQTATASSAVKDLEHLVTSEGFTFNHLQRWGMESQNIPGADSLSGFQDIDEKTATRIVRAKAGLLRALGAIKAEDK